MLAPTETDVKISVKKLMAKLLMYPKMESISRILAEEKNEHKFNG